MKTLLISLSACLFSLQTLATPATPETVQEVLKATWLDKTTQFYHDERFFDLIAQAYLAEIPEADSAKRTRELEQVKVALKKIINTPEFDQYYLNQVSTPFATLYEEEQLIHLLHLTDDPLAKDFYRKSFDKVLYEVEQNYANQDKYNKTHAKPSVEIQKILNTLK